MNWQSITYQDRERVLIEYGNALQRTLDSLDELIVTCINLDRRVPDVQSALAMLEIELTTVDGELKEISEYLDCW